MAMTTAYINGTFYTMEVEGQTCSAVVVRNGKFLYCGEDDRASAMAERVVDLHGATVLPGMIDTHQHVFAYARNLSKLDLSAASSLEDLKKRIHDYVKDIPAGQWVLGSGFDHERFDVPQLPNRYDLDEVCPHCPLIITRYCLHVNIANSLALEQGKIGKGFIPRVPGTVEFDQNGEPTGLLFDAAAGDITAIVQNKGRSLEDEKCMVERACRELNKHGLTGVHPIQGKHCDLPEHMDVYQSLAKEKRLTVRVYLGFDELPGCSIRTGLGDDLVKFGFYKLYGDGNMGGRSALLNAPYSDAPDHNGVCNYTQEELDAKVKEAYDQGIQVGMHVIGDRAAEMLITAIERAYQADPKPNVRFRMIHMSLLNEQILQRSKKLPVVLDVQPMFISSNIKWAESRVGAERIHYMFCYQRMIDAGLTLTAGSDSPCEVFDPMCAIHAAVNRRNMENHPEGGWYPENCISVWDAVSMYTRNAAYVSFEEDKKGTIAEGKLADFVVIDQDIFQIDPLRIKDIKVEQTYLGGELVYERGCDTAV